ncbi:MAG: ArsR/SmtB family transcription factor [Halanaeroarchaeum sp.]
MSGLLPSSSEPEPPDGDPRVIGVDEEDAGDLVAALSSDTARDLFAALHDEPATPSELADRTGTSLQNAQYHLEKLDDADLVEVVDTRYSEKGREMSVFGPSGGPVVLFAGTEEESSEVRNALASLLGGVGVLALASLAVQQALGRGLESLFGGESGDSAVQPAATTTESMDVMMASEDAANASVEATVTQYQMAETATQASGLPPGLVFFVGGALVLAMGAAWWYVRR